MRSSSIVLLWLLALGSLATSASAGGTIQGQLCPHCGHHESCPAVPVTIKEKKHCWQVECKRICIPPIKWPWDDCCEPGCGKVKTVKVLKKIEYECARCGYAWEVPSVCCECCECGQ